MNNEDYCSYEFSKALKAAGFDEPCDHYYNGHGNLNRYADTDRINRNTNGHHTPSCSAPLLFHAQKWLREKKGVVVSVHPESKFLKDERTYKHTGWGYSILRINKNNMAPGPISHVLMAKYEQALSAGISAAQKLIKKEE